MSQELLNKIAEMLAPIADGRNWGFDDFNGDFRSSDQYNLTFDVMYNKIHPQKIAEKIIKLIYDQDLSERLRDALERINSLESKVEELERDKNYRDNQ